MHKFTTINQLLNEAAGGRKKDVDYEDVMVNKKQPKGTPKPPKGTPVEKVLDRVVANLKSHQAGAFSRLTARYERLDKVMKNMIKARDDVNDKVRGELEELFDAEDEVLTRVVQTASWTITLSKFVAGADKPPKITKEYEDIIKGLMELIDEELVPKAEEIIKAFTKALPADDTPTKLTVKPVGDKAEDLSEGLLKQAKIWLSNFVSKMKSWCKSYDRKLADLKADFAAIEEKPIAEAADSAQAKVDEYNTKKLADQDNWKVTDRVGEEGTWKLDDQMLTGTILAVSEDYPYLFLVEVEQAMNKVGRRWVDEPVKGDEKYFELDESQWEHSYH
jgi:hypothetical protein